MKEKAGALLFWGFIAMFFLTSPLECDAAGNQLGKRQTLMKIYRVPGELLVKFKTGISQDEVKTSLAAKRARVVKKSKRSKVRRIKLPSDLSIDKAMIRYLMDPNVEYAEPNYIRYPEVIPNDVDFAELWGLENTGQVVNGVTGTAGADIDAPKAWDITTGSSSVMIAVIDTGVARNHPDLNLNMWVNSAEQIGVGGVDDDGNGYIDDIYGWDFVDNDGDPEDYYAHGSHVAGTIASRGDNVTAITGVNWTAKIMAIRAGGVSGFFTSTIAEAIYYAVDNGAKVINASFGGPGFSQTTYDAISYANDHGVLFVAAAGNDSSDNDSNPFYPSNYSLPSIVSVAATNQNDSMASFSNYGSTSVDVAAPGTNTYSTIPTFSYGPQVTVYSESFDPLPNPGVWNVSGANFTWDFGVGTGVGNTNCLEDSPGGNYLDNTNSLMYYTNSFNSVKNNRYTLSFSVQYELENPSDLFYSVTSPDGNSWWSLDYETGNSGGAFVPRAIDYTFMADLYSSFYLGFWLFSNSSQTLDGVYLDDLHLYREPININSYSYAYYQGTSMASPHVAGVAGLVKAQNPNYSHLQIRDSILNTVDSKPALSGKMVTGGRVNAFGAVTYIAPSTGVVAVGRYEFVTLSWNPNSESTITSYVLSYGTTPALGTVVNVGNVTTYQVNGLINGTIYYFAVKARADFPGLGTIEGKNSSTVTATPSPAEKVVKAVAQSGSSGGGCFIATAAYGSRMAREVRILAQFRDNFLLTNAAGRILVKYYYEVSPPLTEFIAKHDTLRAVVRWSLLPLVGVSWLALKLGPTATLVLLVLVLMSGATVAVFRKIRPQEHRG